MAVITLQFPPECLQTLRNHPRLREIASGRASGRALRCAYFAVAGLGPGGVIVRVVRNGGRYRQSVVREGAVVFSGPAADETPALDTILDPTLREQMNGAGVLMPAFRHEARVFRRPVTLNGTPGATIEIEDGTLSAEEGERPYGVLRIRSSDDDLAPAYALAAELAGEVPLRIAPRNPEELGFALAAAAKPTPVKADKRPLPDETTVEEALVHIVRACLDHLVANEAPTLENDDPEGVHQMRVALRRMRSGLRLYRHMLPAGQYEGLVAELKWVTAALGPTRDLDVFLDEILAPVAAGLPDAAPLETLRELCREARDEARAATREAVSSSRYGRFVIDMHRWVERRSWREQPVTETAATLFRPAAVLGAEALHKSYRQVRKRGRVFADLPPDERHRLRIGVKRLRYALDFFGSLYRAKAVREFTERLSRLQDDLGYANDVSVAHRLLDQLQARAEGSRKAAARYAGALVLGWHQHALSEIEEKVIADIESFLDEKTFWPKPQREA